ncbi:hypothetical protein ACLOJK_039377 [Asimina triloba]
MCEYFDKLRYDLMVTLSLITEIFSSTQKLDIYSSTNLAIHKYGSVPAAYEAFLLAAKGHPRHCNRFREMSTQFLASLRPSIGCYRYWIELELNLACVGDHEGLASARKLYESALSTYKHEIQLWQDYYSMEVKVGTSETANAVYWRARKTLGERAGLMVPCNP